jgi:Xaa-Pro aminopeptidase
MHTQNLDRFQALLEEQGLQAALLSNPATLTWLTGYAPPIQTGPSPFEGGPALGWWRDGQITLVLSDAEAGGAAETGALVRDYLSYTIDEPLQGSARQAEALRALLQPAAGARPRIGVEYAFLPAPMAEVLRQVFPGAAVQALDGAFDLLRAVKTPEEIDKIQAALALCDAAQAFVAAQALPGTSEIELWGQMKAHLEAAAGARLPVLADLVAGPRTAEIGGLPGGYRFRPGDAIIADIVPRLNGYWGDNAGTHFVDEPPAELRKIFQVARDTLRKGIEAVKPGLPAGDLDRALRAEIERSGYRVYPHHSGHGLGASFHEEPRLVPYNRLPLRPGMVVAIEPGIYVPGVGGVRLEDVVLVTEDGCRVLTHHLDAVP